MTVLYYEWYKKYCGFNVSQSAFFVEREDYHAYYIEAAEVIVVCTSAVGVLAAV